MSDMTGKCLCGAVRFTARNVEVHHHACHCGMCRRWSGGPVMAAPVESVAFQGEAKMERYQSSDLVERGFCKTCGASLFCYVKPIDRYYMCVGAFDDQTSFRLTGEIFVDNKPAGYAFVGDHTRLTEAEFMAQFAVPETKA